MAESTEVTMADISLPKVPSYKECAVDLTERLLRSESCERPGHYHALALALVREFADVRESVMPELGKARGLVVLTKNNYCNNRAIGKDVRLNVDIYEQRLKGCFARIDFYFVEMGHYLLAYPTHHPLPSPERLVQLLQQTLSEIDTLLARFLPPFSVSVNSYKSSLILFAGGQRLRECVVDEETAEDLEKELKLMKREGALKEEELSEMDYGQKLYEIKSRVYCTKLGNIVRRLSDRDLDGSGQ